MSKPLFESVHLKVRSVLGNAFSIIAIVRDILSRTKFDKAEIKKSLKI